MVIIWGTRAKEARAVHVEEQSCPACKKTGLFITPIFRYFHIMFIPTCPTTKYWFTYCPHCKATFAEDASPISDELKSTIKRPKWMFAGLFIIISLFIFPHIAAIFR